MMHSIISSLLLLFSFHVYAFLVPPTPLSPPQWLQNIDDNSYNWFDLVPSRDLEYQPCYGDFECARLLVPLDWQNSSDSREIAIAVIRLPAQVSEDDPSHGGSIIINPGGPGGSGVMTELFIAKLLQAKLDNSQHFEIVSSDPRGIGFSTPSLRCFGRVADEVNWLGLKRATGNVDAGSNSIRYHWAAEKARGKLCSDVDSAHDAEMRSYVSTSSVARDMLEIVERIDKLKHTKSADILQTPLQSPLTHQQSQIQYLGLSYGTYLGNVFASMYPDRVKRMLLDSTLDAHDWTHSLKHMLTDTDKIVDLFFDRCFKVKNDCALYRADDQNSTDIQQRFFTALTDLRENPITGAEYGVPEVNTYYDLFWIILQSLYAPLASFPLLAIVVNDILTKRSIFLPSPPACAICAVPGLEYLANGDATVAVLCSDGPDLRNGTLADYERHVDKTKNQSMFWPIEAEIRMPCWSWPFRPKWRYAGPFNSTVPILFANNRYDPVTPIENAHKMASQHKGSVVLEHAAAGHGALFQMSECMWKHANRYFNDGTLPEKGTICHPDCEPFDMECLKNPKTGQLDEWMTVARNLFTPDLGRVSFTERGR